jgi:ABC-type glycerol-3-phosphate transport system substrate-binding protein
MKPKFSYIGVLIILVSLLAACGGGAVEEPASPGEMTGTVRMIKGPFGPTEQEDFDTMIDRFNVEFPNIEASFEMYDWTNQEVLITQAIAGGDYDLIYIPEGMYPKFAFEDGPLTDMSFCVDDPAWAEQRDNVTYWEDATTPGGTIFGIPNVWIPESHLVVNLSLLEAVDAPDDWYETMDGVRDTAMAITEKYPDVYGYGFRTAGLKDLYQHDWYGYILRSGAGYLNEEQTACGLNKPELVTTFQWLVDLMNEDKVTPAFGEYTWEGLRGLFQGGKLAMTHDEPPIVGVLESNPPDFEYAFFPIPGIVNNNQFTFRGFYSIPAASKDAQAACEFAKFLVLPEQEAWYLNKSGGLYPALKDLGGIEMFADRYPALAEGMELGELAQGPEMHPQYLEFQNLTAPLFDQMMTLEITPQEMIDSACEQIESRLE